MSDSGSTADSSADLSAKLRRGSLLLVSVAVGGFGADYALNVGLTRLLTPHEYGDYRVAQAFATLLGVVVLLGGDRSTTLALSAPLARGRTAFAWEYLRFFLRLALALSAVAIAATWAASALHLGATDAEKHHALAWLVVSVPLVALGGLFSRALLASGRAGLAALPWRIGFPVLKLGALGLVALVLGGVTLHQTLAIAIVVVAAITTLQWWQLRRLVLPTLEREPAMSTPRVWLATSVPLMGTFLVSLALNQSDLYLLEMLGGESDVGHYAAAGTTAHFLTLLQATVVTLVSPLLYQALDRSRAEGLVVLRAGQRLLLWGLVPAGVLLTAFAGPILRLFGPTYGDVRLELILLVWGNFLWATTALAALWLQAHDGATHLLGLTVGALALDLVLDWLFIPHYGVLGAAGSTAVVLTLTALSFAWLGWRAIQKDEEIS